jgi:hypothetical protein
MLFSLSDKKDGIGGACGTYGGENTYIQGFGAKTWRKETIGKT